MDAAILEILELRNCRACQLTKYKLFKTVLSEAGFIILHINNIQKENLLGSFLMVVAMAAFAVEDSVIKFVSSALPVGQILFLLGSRRSLNICWIGFDTKKRDSSISCFQ